MNLVVYTCIFGNYEGLLPQIKTPGVDFVCITDGKIRSKCWKIMEVAPILANDPARSSRHPKILPHLYFPHYSQSVYVDANMILKSGFAPWVLSKLAEKDFWAFDHERTCIYDEHKAIVDIQKAYQTFKDYPEVMLAQISRYKQENYPANNGLISGGILLRNHHSSKIKETMEHWWNEVKNGSRRDQLSFNYVAWKTGLDYGILSGSVTRSEYFHMIGIHRKDYSAKYIRYRLKKLFKLI